MANNIEKYPHSSQKLFRPRLPLSWRKPIDYQPASRRTPHIDPIAAIKDQIHQYHHEHPVNERAEASRTTQEANTNAAMLRRLKRKLSFDRQRREWDDPELLQKHEREVMKDPYRTVFLARIPYLATEVELSNSFVGYGPIETIRIIRDHHENPKGYGFLVYERELDAQACVKDLAALGLRLHNRTILVDMERGRLVRGWRPRRLGGGLGGRHYTRPNALHSNTASAAASGRRLNVYHSGGNGPSGGNGRRRNYERDGVTGSSGAGGSSGFTGSRARDVDRYEAYRREPARDRNDRSIRDGGSSEVAQKYAKYGVPTVRRDERSIRSIRE